MGVSIVGAFIIYKLSSDCDIWKGNCKCYPDSKVHGANMGPIWGRQAPGGTHVGPMNFDIARSAVVTEEALST